ncbi:threonine-phosphate decarboxylase CobD [Anaerobacillus sp. MEB173]|uniref:threonine-phosphate decarboxylase CobD n=1 Tax=Anaerobacillus sp. MEB173 TaxID=3383345 RepID=UPI003F8E953D
MVLPNHGANPNHTIEALGLTVKQEIIDFSVNTNPYGSPAEIKEQWLDYFQNVESYPDPHVKELRQEISKTENISADHILVGNGAAELIFLIGNHFRQSRVLIVEPTFSEYRDACEAFGSHVESFLLSEENGWQIDVEKLVKEMKNKDLLFICHPNNPTGVVYQPSHWGYLFKKAEELGVVVIVDEAFYDFCMEDISVSEFVKEYANLIVLRSLTKMYAIAGIRLGYLLAHPSLIGQLRQLQHPWSVNGLAQKIGLVCLNASSHAKKSREKIAVERERLFPLIREQGFILSQSSTNYYLIREHGHKKDMKSLMTFLIEHGIIPRHTYNFKGLDGKYLRLAIKTETENNKLLDVLRGWKR